MSTTDHTPDAADRPAPEFGPALRQAREVVARHGDWRLAHWEVAALVAEYDRLRAALAAAPAGPDDAHTETVTEYRVMAGEHRIGTSGDLATARYIAEAPQFAERSDVRVEARTVTTSRRESEWKATEPERHFMLPGTHEWPRTPECRCGAVWFRDADACARQFDETGAQR